MSSLSKTQQKQLSKMFGERLTFDKTERKLYGHDIAAMPSMVKPVIGDTTPDAVVQPTSRGAARRADEVGQRAACGRSRRAARPAPATAG